MNLVSIKCETSINIINAQAISIISCDLKPVAHPSSFSTKRYQVSLSSLS